MSTSASQSKTETQNYQQSTQGATGDRSPTITGGGAITINDAGGEVSLASLAAMGDVVKQALTVQSTLADQAIRAQASGQDTSAGLISSVLANNQQLAQNSQTGGATASIKSLNYIIVGGLGLAALAIGALVFRKK